MRALAAEEPLVTTAAFAAFMVLAGVLDVTSRRLPNALTVPALVVGFLLRVPFGLSAVADGLLGAGLALMITIPFFLTGALGGGDAKLLAAVGAFMGPNYLAGACLLVALLGGLIALNDAIRRGALRPVLMNTLRLVVGLIYPARWSSSSGATLSTSMSIPYGVAIATGSLVWWFWGQRLV